MLQEHLKPTIKIAYHAFLALPEENKLAYLELIEHQMEFERLQTNLQTKRSLRSFIGTLKSSSVFSNDPVLIQNEGK